MARASIAYQAARQKGSGTVAFYSTEIQNKIMEAQGIIASFLPALEAHEFVVYYQPRSMPIRTKSVVQRRWYVGCMRAD